MNKLKKISKTFITFLLTLMLIFQSVITSFVGATTSFAEDEQNQATITISDSKNGSLIFENSKDKTYTALKGSNINVIVNPSMGYETGSVKMETENGKKLDLPVAGGKVNVPIIDNAKLSVVFSKSESQPVAVEEEKQDENLNAEIIKAKEKNTIADKSDKRNRYYKENIDDSETIAEILLNADRSKVGEGTSVIAKDIVTVANTLINMRKTKARTLDELWKDRDGDGESDDWMAMEFQFDTVVPLYEVNENAEYYVAKPNLAKGENYQLLQYLIGDSNMSGTKLNNVSYDKKTGLLYVPKRILFPNDPKYKTDKPIGRIGRTRIQFLVGLNKPIKETKAEVKVKIDSEDSVKGSITKSGKAEVNAMANDTKIVLAKDEDAKNSIKANSIDEIRINGHKVNLDNAKYYEKEGVLELPIKPVNTDTIEIKLSNSIVKDVKNVIGSIIEPTISFAANNGPLDARAFISEWFYFDTSPRAGDVWKLAGTNIYRDAGGSPIYEKVYPSNKFGSDSGVYEAIRKILNNTFTNYDIQSIEREIGTGVDRGFNYYLRHSTILADTYGSRHAQSGASLTINNNFNLSLHCAHVGVKTNFEWGNKNVDGAGKEWDNAGTYIRLIDTDGQSWALFGIISPTQKTQAGVGFFGVHIRVKPPTEKTYGFSIKKTDKNTGETLRGATFKVEPISVSGTNPGTITQTTGYSGVVNFSGLPRGTYRVSEVSAPSGYSRIYDTSIITLPDYDGSTYNFQNVPSTIPTPDPTPDPRPNPSGGTLKLKKTDAATGRPIKGAKFELKQINAEGTTYTVPVYGYTGNYEENYSANKFFEMETDYSGEIEVKVKDTGISNQYYFVEKKPASGYDLPSDTSTSKDWIYGNGGTASFTMTNRKTPETPPDTPPDTPPTGDYALIMQKVDGYTGLKITGSSTYSAKFRVKDPDGLTVWADTHPTADTAKAGNVYVQSRDSYNDEFKIDSINGSFAILGLEKKGTYTIEEISAPSGYNKSSTKQTVTVSDYQKIGTTEFKNYGTPPETPTTGEYKIHVTKVDENGNDIDKNLAKEAEFELYDPDGRKVYVSSYLSSSDPFSRYVQDDSSYSSTIKLGDYSSFSVLKLKKTGQYTLYERKAPKGYKKIDVPIRFNVRDQSDFTELRITNEKEQLQTYNIEVTKVDSNSGSPITGSEQRRTAEFRLKDPNGRNVYVSKIREGEYKLDKSSSNSTLKLSYNGKIKVSGLEQKGRYSLEELTAPTGYKLPTSALTCNVQSTNNSFTFKNSLIPKPQDGSLKVIKKDSDTNKVLSGVVFELLDSNKNLLRTATTNSQGIAEFTKLEYGKYYIREKSTIKGYVLSNSLEELEITSGNKAVTHTVYNHKSTGNVKLWKYDSKKQTIIPSGTKFKLYRKIAKRSSTTTEQVKVYFNKDKNLYEEDVFENDISSLNRSRVVENVNNILVTGKDTIGEIEVRVNRISDSSLGEKVTYYFEEIKPTDGYKLPANPKSEEKELTLTYPSGIIKMYNEPIEKYNITVTKVDSATGNAITDSSKLQNAEFRLKDPDGKDVYITKVSDGVYKKDSSHNYIMKLSNDGKLRIQDLDKKGKYTLTEVKAPTGYQLSSTPLVCNVANINNSFTFKNTQIPKDGIVRITKKDLKTGDVLSGVVFELLDSTKQVVKTATTNSQGIAEFTGLKYGNYYVREKSTKAGYILKTDLEQARVTSTYKIEKLTIYNEKELYNLSVTKVDSKTGKAIVDSEKLKNAEFRLKDPDGKDVYITKVSDGVYKKDSSHNYTMKLSNEGKLKIQGLDKKGKYTLTEVKAPTGYQLSNTPLVCDVVNKDNSFTFKNTQIPKDGSVTIIKKDSKNQKVLSGVTFELLDKDKRLITTSKTGSTGIARFSNLEYGKYYIREKETIKGYKLNSQLHEVNISNANKSIALSLYNEPIEKTIKVIKKDNNGELLKDAEFTLFKKDGLELTKVESKVTNAKGEIEFSNLRIGRYVLRETKAPNGFRPYSKDIEIDLMKQVSPVYTVTLNNYKVEENIPSTGTRGATVFLASGLGIIMLAYIFKKRKIFA